MKLGHCAQETRKTPKNLDPQRKMLLLGKNPQMWMIAGPPQSHTRRTNVAQPAGASNVIAPGEPTATSSPLDALRKTGCSDYARPRTCEAFLTTAVKAVSRHSSLRAGYPGGAPY